MAKAKKIVITGIPGSGSTEFCSRYALADPSRQRVKVYNMGDMLLQLAQETPLKPPVPAENLPNLQPEFLNTLRDRVFDTILAMISRDENDYDRLLIDMHAQFFWNDVFTNAYDWRYLSQLNADMFITLIEKPSLVKQRQLATPQGRCQNHDLRDLLLWMNSEVNITQGWAANFSRPHYVLPGKQDPLTIESLLVSAFLMYFQMPITGITPQIDAIITAFKKKLLEIGKQLTGLPTPLIDPRTIDIEPDNGLSAREKLAIRVHTVHRDANLYIPESSVLVAFYPVGTKLSQGVGYETTRGFETGKNAFVIYPEEHTSPFMDIATEVFTSEEKFFEFFPAYMQQRMETLRRIF